MKLLKLTRAPFGARGAHHWTQQALRRRYRAGDGLGLNLWPAAIDATLSTGGRLPPEEP